MKLERPSLPTKCGFQRTVEALGLYRAALHSKGCWPFFPSHDTNTITHRVKPYQRRVTQVLSKQIFREGVGTPWHLWFLSLPASLSFVRFTAAFKGTRGRRKRKMSGEREKGGGGNGLLSSLLLRNKSHTTCKNHLLSTPQRQRVRHWFAEGLRRSCVDVLVP